MSALRGLCYDTLNFPVSAAFAITMSYPGNTSLGDEVKHRILATFEQSLELAETGKRQEATLGCDFILELDPQFAPARTLKERVSSAVGSADVSDLRQALGGLEPEAAPPEELPEPGPPPAASPGPAIHPPVDDLFDLEEIELPSAAGEPAGQPPHAGASPGPSEPPPTASAPAAPSAELGPELARRLAAGDFEGVLARAAEAREAVMADPELGRLVETAQSRMEAQPYVEAFLREADAALTSGDGERARVALDKARSLDPENPKLAELERRQAEASEAVAEPAAEPAPAAPAEPEPVPEPGASAPLAGGGEAEGDDRIAELLAEGQRASEAGDYQGAIDAWSRIFLIDVDHEEAARRIEEARRLKAEQEREIEEVFHEGLDALEAGDQETARARFQHVIEAQPNHLAAREYLQQMESGAPVKVTKPSPDDTASMGQLGSFDLSDLAAHGHPVGDEELKEEILVPPAPGEVQERAPEGEAEVTAGVRGSAVKRDLGRRSFLIIGGAVLVLVVVAAWFVYQNKERFFPNSTAEEEVAQPAPPAPDPIERAQSLHDRGQTAMALGQLKRIPPDSPRYAAAQKLIAEWEVPKKPAEETETIAPEAAARRNRLLHEANTAYEQKEYLRALELFDRAGKISELDGRDLDRFQAAGKELEPLKEEIELFHQGEYEFVLPKLWKLYQADPTNRDVRRLIVDSYYNRGVRELQRGDTMAAAKEFNEALEVVPGDRDLQRLYLFAQTYEHRQKDLLYRIYVKYLPFR